MQFFLKMPIPSATAQTKRLCTVGGKPRFFPGAKLKAARQEILLRLAPHKPSERIPKPAPVKLVVRFVYAANKRHPELTWKTTRPDTDNLIKLLKDCMTEMGYWEDDAQVASELTEKGYGKHEGIYIRVEQMENSKLD